MKATQLSLSLPETKKPGASSKATLLVCNSMQRADWGFFRAIWAGPAGGAVPARIEALLVIPTNVMEARNRLRELLLAAYAEQPYRLVRMVCFGGGRGSSVVKNLAAAMARNGEVECRRSSARRADGLEDNATRAAVDYILSHLWVLDDKPHYVSTKAVYAALNTSTKEPIRAWLPESAGVVAYLRARIGHITLAYFEAQQVAASRAYVALEDCEGELAAAYSPEALEEAAC